MSGIAVLTVILLTIAFCPASLRLAGQPTSRGGERGENVSNWDGIWNTTFGHMELAQSGNRVFGTYRSTDGYIAGTIKSGNLIFTWSERAGDGFLTGNGGFTLSDNDSSFTGWFKYSNDKEKFDWTGSRVGDRELEVTRADVDYCLWRGVWVNSCDAIMFSQDIAESTVSGEFIQSGEHGTFSGRADGWTVDIVWETEHDSGTGHLGMSSDLASFTGLRYRDTKSFEVEWNGEFISAGMRETNSGEWMTDWGKMNFEQEEETGSINAAFLKANIGEMKGSSDLVGVAVGPVCAFEWTLVATDSEIRGRGSLIFSDDNQSFSGWYTIGDGDSSRYELTGNRQQQ